MPSDLTVLRTGRGSPQVQGRAYCTTVTLGTGGTATLTWTDIDGIDGAPASEPYAFITGPSGSEYVSAKGTSQCTLNGGAGDAVEVMVVIPETL